MDPRPEKNFVGIDVADARHDPLVEKESLDTPLPAPKPPRERFPARFQGFGPESVQLRGGARRLETAQESELPDVAEAELQRAARKRHDEPDMFVHRVGGPRQKELARHLQVEDERPTPFAGDEDHLSSAPQAEDPLPLEDGEPAAGRPAKERGEKETGGTELGSLEAGREAADDGFDLGKLGHGAIVLDLGDVFD